MSTIQVSRRVQYTSNFTIKLSRTILKKHKCCHNFVIWVQKCDLFHQTIAAIRYELKYHNSRTSVERGQLVEDRLLPKPEDSGTRQSCILTIPEKNQIFLNFIYTRIHIWSSYRVFNTCIAKIKNLPRHEDLDLMIT